MKIRIKSNAIRYRLTRSDVKQLAITGHISNKADFGAQALFYEIKLTDDTHLSSAFKNNTISLFMPKNMISELINTDRVGFENSDDALHLLVEKDFTCLDNVTEDQSDNYLNPLADKVL